MAKKQEEPKKADPVIGEKPATPTGVEAPSSTALDFKIGAILFYKGRQQGDNTTFESLPAPERQAWRQRAVDVLVAISQLNLRVVVAKDEDPQETRQEYRRNIDMLTQIIKSFVGGLKSTKKELFPYEELAHRIMNGGK